MLGLLAHTFALSAHALPLISGRFHPMNAHMNDTNESMNHAHERIEVINVDMLANARTFSSSRGIQEGIFVHVQVSIQSTITFDRC